MNNKRTYKLILHHIKKYMPLVIFSLIFAAASVALTLYAPILTGRAIDYIIGPSDVDFDAIREVIIQLGVVILLTAVFQWFMNILNNNITYRVVNDIRTKAFDHLENLPLKYIDSKQYGDVVSRIVADIDQFSDGLLMGFSQLFTGVVTIIGTLGFMLSISVRITAAVVVITPVSLFVAAFIAKRTYNMFLLQ